MARALGHLPIAALSQIDVHQLRLPFERLNHSAELAEAIADDPTNDKARRLVNATCERVAKLSAGFRLSPLDQTQIKFEPEPKTVDAFDRWAAKDTRLKVRPSA